MGDRFAVQGADLRVLLADGQRLTLDLLSMYLAAQGALVTQACGFDGAMAALRPPATQDVLLADLDLPGMGGTAGLRRLVRAAGAPVAVLVPQAHPGPARDILDAGAAGLLPRSMTARGIAAALRLVQAGERYLPPDMALPHPPAGAPFGLSPRERDVLALLAEGRPNKGIAAAMRLAEPTVKMHVTAICRKLGAANRTQAAVTARRAGLFGGLCPAG